MWRYPAVRLHRADDDDGGDDGKDGDEDDGYV